MDRILNFVAIRPPSQDVPSAPALAASSNFQGELATATAGPNPLDDAVAAAQSFAESGRFLTRADEVNHGVEFLALYERLTHASPRTTADIKAEVRKVVGDSQPSEWADDATRARDSVLA